MKYLVRIQIGINEYGSLEDGLQYEYFKNNYQEGKMCTGKDYWERSLSASNAFCYVYSTAILTSMHLIVIVSVPAFAYNLK